MYEKINPNGDVETASVSNDLAYCLEMQHKYDETLTLVKYAIQMMEKIGTTTHPFYEKIKKHEIHLY